MVAWSIKDKESLVYLYSWSIFFIVVNDCEMFEERPK